MLSDGLDDTGHGGRAPGVRVTAREWWDEAVRSRVLVLRHLPLAGWPLVLGAVVLNVLLGVLPVAFVVATSALVGRVPAAVQAGVPSSAWDTLVSAFLLSAATFVALQVLVPVQTALGELVQRRVDGVVQERLMTDVLALPGLAPLEDDRCLDALKEATQHIKDGWQTAGSACAGMLALVARYLQLGSLAVLLGTVSSWGAAAALTAAVALFRYGQRGGLRRYARVWQSQMPRVRRADYLREVATGPAAAKDVRIFGLSTWVGERYASAYLAYIEEIWRRRRQIFFRPYVGYTVLGLAATGAALVTVTRAALDGSTDLTGLALGLQATMASVALGSYYPEADLQTNSGIRAVRASRRFARLALETAAVPATPPPGHPVRVGGPVPPPHGAPATTLRLHDVSFTYPRSTTPVLDRLDLDLPVGRCTAVVGVNGAGKTTLVKLLTRLHEPTHGHIEVDGTDLADLDHRAWRRQTSVVFQDFVRYELSAAENIALGAPHVPVDLDLVRDCAHEAGILAALERLPSGLATPLARSYPGGADLSGGQWQRVAIARAVYAMRTGARLLILDEPTSALDVRAEVAFFEQFVELTRGVTTLLISHRFSSVRRADRIVVLEKGRLVEAGTHRELVAAAGTYAHLFDLQARRFTTGDDADERDLDTPGVTR